MPYMAARSAASILLRPDSLKAYRKLEKLVRESWVSTSQRAAPPLDQRISVSITKVPRLGFVPCIHVNRKDSVAFIRAQEILKEFSFVQARLGGGEAHSEHPRARPRLDKRTTDGRLVPGAAISHGRFAYGTLGCIVEVEENQKKVLYAVTAAHVLNLTDSAKIGDEIYCPGKGSIPQIDKSGIFGYMRRATPLYPINPDIRDDVDDIDIYFDIALVEITDKSEQRLPCESLVPNPRNPSRSTMKLTGAVQESDLGDWVTKEVYIIGARSGYRKGILTDVDISQKILRLPNRRNYLYRHLMGVVPVDGNEVFSQPGDSGAAVYTRNGLLLGFLIGADRNVSLLCIADRALKNYKARIV
jgi:hypothetical protein